MQEQPRDDIGDMREIGGSPKGRQVGRLINGSHFPGHHVGYRSQGDPATRAEASHTKVIDQCLAGQTGVQEERTAVADWEVVPRLQGSTSGPDLSEVDD